MNDDSQSKLARFERALANLDLLERSGRRNDPLLQDYFRRSLTEGKHGEKAAAILQRMLIGPSVLAGFATPPEPPEPELDPKQTVFIGFRRMLRRMTGMIRQLLTNHLLIQGATGSGKTNVIWFILDQLIAARLRVVFHCYKNDGRKLLRRYPGVVVLSVSQFRENFLEPVGDPKAYFTAFWSHFGTCYRLRRETVVKLIAIAIRVSAGLKSGEPYPSLQDCTRLLRKIAATEKDPSLETAATAIESLIATLGPCARVIKGPCADELFQIVVVQCHGLPPDFLQFFMGIRLYRQHLKAIVQGHTGELKAVIVSDEGGLEFAKELSFEPGSGNISFQKRLTTQMRSTGTSLIVAAQSISAIDPTVIANVGSFLCLRAQADADVRMSARLLGLPDERLPEVRNIPRWSGLFKTPLHPEAVLVDIPEMSMGDYMSDAELDRLNRPALERLDALTVFAPAHDGVGSPIFYREILGEAEPDNSGAATPESFDIRDEYRTFVAEILANPEVSVVAHYANLRWSVGRGTRVKRDLEDNGIIESRRQASRNGRPVERLVLTEKGKQVFHDHA